MGAKMLSKVAVAGFALMVSTAGAFAADMPMKAYSPPVSPTFDWTGFYLSVGGGYQGGTVNGSGTTGNNVTTSVTYVDVGAGYRKQLPFGLVLGLDVSAPVWIAKSSFTASVPGGAFAPVSSAQANFLVLPEFQIGYAIDRWLPYAGFGVGVANIKATTNPAPGVFASDTQSSPVFIASFGLDYALTNNWILGVRYDHLEGAQHNFVFNIPGAAVATVSQLGAVTDGVSGVLKYKF
jgi:outer membrane immunogenic protein